MNEDQHNIALHRPDVKPRISIVMVTYFTGPALFESVNTVLNDPEIFELILVDNGNSEPTRKNLSDLISRHPNVRLLQGHGNVGFAKACNYGAEIAEGEFLLFLNPDAILTPGSARNMANCGKMLEVPWIVGGLLRTEDGQEQRGSRRARLTLWRAIMSFVGLDKILTKQTVHLESRPMSTSPVEMPVVSGALLMTDRDSFSILEGFDEGYFLHVEDIDICERVHRLGGQVYFHPKASAMHYGSTSKVTRQRIEWEKFKGFVRYFWKFSNNPLEKVVTILGVPFMMVAIMARAMWINIKHAFTGR